MILTIHMKSGRQVAVHGASQGLVDFLISAIYGTSRQAARSIEVGATCDRILVSGTNYRDVRTTEVIIVLAEVEFVQFDAPKP